MYTNGLIRGDQNVVSAVRGAKAVVAGASDSGCLVTERKIFGGLWGSEVNQSRVDSTVKMLQRKDPV